MRFILPLCLTLAVFSKVHALNLHELYVSGYDVPDQYETEIEWLSSLSSLNILRSTVEMSHGFSKKIGAGIYADFTRDQYSKLDNSAWRAFVKSTITNYDSASVNWAGLIEVELPQDDDESLAVEAKLIADRKFERVQVIVTPVVEYVRLRVRNQDGDEVEYETGVDAAVKYHHSDKLVSNLTYKSELSGEKEAVFLLGTDYEPQHGLEFSFGLGVTTDQENLLKFGFETEVF